MRAVGKALIGKNRLIDLDYINKIYVSPRIRAQTTLKLLLEAQEEHQPPEALNIITVSEYYYLFLFQKKFFFLLFGCDF